MNVGIKVTNDWENPKRIIENHYNRWRRTNNIAKITPKHRYQSISKQNETDMKTSLTNIFIKMHYSVRKFWINYRDKWSCMPLGKTIEYAVRG